MRVHPTAIISEGAVLGEGVEVGPYAVIGENVRIGPGTKIGAHAMIDGWTEIGEECEIFPFAFMAVFLLFKRTLLTFLYINLHLGTMSTINFQNNLRQIQYLRYW